MIFVTVGSSTIPFDRLLRAIDGVRTEERLVVQHGASRVRPRRADCVDFLGYTEFVELVRDARVTVTHAGVGSIMTALFEQRRPIVVPRLGAYGEAVDDHQVLFARRAGELGLVTVIEDVDLLGSAIAEHSPDALVPATTSSPIEVELRSYIEECIGPATILAAGSRSTT